MTTAVAHEMLTRPEAAAYLGVKVPTLAAWKSTGRYGLPCVKVGRLVKYRRADLDEFIRRNTTTSTAEESD